MKKVRILLIVLCFAMILPLLVACEKEEEKINTNDKYIYDDSSRERAADSIPEGYDLEDQTIGLFYAQHVEKTRHKACCIVKQSRLRGKRPLPTPF